jgi:hypothetical protein
VTKDEFRQRWQQTDAQDVPGLEQLYSDYERESAAAIRGLAVLATQKDGVGPHAASVFAQLGEAAWPALAGKSDYASLGQLGRLVTGVEAAVVAYLKRALQDGRPVPRPRDHERLEMPVPITRVADEAYLALRRLTSGETELAGLLESESFLDLPEPQRNAEIEQYARTGLFTRFVPSEEE